MRKSSEILLHFVAMLLMVVIMVAIFPSRSASIFKGKTEKTEVVETRKVHGQNKGRSKKSNLNSENASTVSESVKPIKLDGVKLTEFMLDGNLDALEEILFALREEDADWRKVKAVADAMFAISNWKSRVGEDIQYAILDIVAEHTPNTLPELLGFLESVHEDIREEALDEIVDSIEEMEDDASAGELIVKLSQTIADEDFADRLMFHIDMMDDADVAGKTIRGVYRQGNDVFKKALIDNFDEIFDSESTDIDRNIDDWVKEQKDDDSDD